MMWELPADCDACLAVDPKFVKAITRKGKVLHFLKSYHKAMECYKEAQELAPDDSEIREAMEATQRAIYSPVVQMTRHV
jgi:tetratricopeptide (TPR) repeat protein